MASEYMCFFGCCTVKLGAFLMILVQFCLVVGCTVFMYTRGAEVEDDPSHVLHSIIIVVVLAVLVFVLMLVSQFQPRNVCMAMCVVIAQAVYTGLGLCIAGLLIVSGVKSFIDAEETSAVEWGKLVLLGLCLLVLPIFGVFTLVEVLTYRRWVKYGGMD